MPKTDEKKIYHEPRPKLTFGRLIKRILEYSLLTGKIPLSQYTRVDDILVQAEKEDYEPTKEDAQYILNYANNYNENMANKVGEDSRGPVYEFDQDLFKARAGHMARLNKIAEK